MAFRCLMSLLMSTLKPAWRPLAQTIVLASVLVAQSVTAATLQIPATRSELLQQVGSGRLRWFGFHVYDASTWAAQATLPVDGSISPPFALQLVYARAISARDLVQATATAWDDLDLLDDRAKQWLPLLAQFWPDVKAGDCLVLLVDQQQQVQFFYNGKLLGIFGDIDFARRFAAIWLHPDSSEPALRRQLLGSESS
jgi:hypothetical protein